MDASIDTVMPSLSMQLDQQLDGVIDKRIETANQTDNQNSLDHQLFFSKGKVEDLVDEANRFMQEHLTESHYVLHDKLKQYYVQIVDTDTQKVIREIPPKKFLDMYAAIAEKLGLIVNAHA